MLLLNENITKSGFVLMHKIQCLIIWIAPLIHFAKSWQNELTVL